MSEHIFTADERYCLYNQQADFYFLQNMLSVTTGFSAVATVFPL